MILQDTIPYCFEYRGKKIYESAWNRLTVKILEMLDELNPLSEEHLLSLEYSWSNILVFSATKRTNFSKFKDIYVNTNHTATHSGMSIKFLLQEYGVNLDECIFYIRKHPVAESTEVRSYFCKQTEEAFRLCLKYQGKTDKSIDIIVNNFSVINKILAQGSTGFDDFFLFDDYLYFTSYRNKTMEIVKNKYYGSKKYDAMKSCLDKLDNFYRHRDFYLKLKQINITDEFKEVVCTELEFLFHNLNTNIISVSKLYARMSLLHDEMMEDVNLVDNLADFSKLVGIILPSKYIFKKPFIANDSNAIFENDKIIMNYVFTLEEFDLNTINNYVDKLHLKRLDNYVAFMEMCSKYFVQVDSDKMISRDEFEIQENDLERIKKELNYYINSFGNIEVSKYCDFSSFPTIRSEWNKYLLVGVTRTFLDQYFSVESTAGSYKSVEYVIKIK